MKILILLILAATLSLGGCASLIQSASVSEAYKHYELQKYERTLELITQAENADAMSDDMKAELTYLKAQTYERLGLYDTAQALYEYLAKEHGKTQYGYIAVKQLNAS
jgi:lipoprotein NlpI